MKQDSLLYIRPYLAPGTQELSQHIQFLAAGLTELTWQRQLHFAYAKGDWYHQETKINPFLLLKASVVVEGSTRPPHGCVD